MRNWTNNIARTALVAAGLAMVGAGLGPGSATADITNGDYGAYSGNQLYAPDNTPINVCGNAVGIVSVAKAWCYGGAHVYHGKGNVTSGKHSIGSGNQTDRSDNTPINVCGNAIGVIGVAKAECRGGATVGEPNGGHGYSQHRTSAEGSGKAPAGALDGLPTGPLHGADPVRSVGDLAGSIGLPDRAPALPQPAPPAAPAPKAVPPAAKKPAKKPVKKAPVAKSPAAKKPLHVPSPVKLPSTKREQGTANQRRDVPDSDGLTRGMADTLGLPATEGLPDATGLPGAQGLTDSIMEGMALTTDVPTGQSARAKDPATLPAPAAKRFAVQNPPDPFDAVRDLVEALGVPVRPFEQVKVPTEDQADEQETQPQQPLQQQLQKQSQTQQPGRPPAQSPAKSDGGPRPDGDQQQKANKPTLPLEGLPINIGRGTPLSP
ncbi:hypothetical protein GCM10010191_57540 [Actinomadura vinacea]|uniref:Chaplin domain-containing protein n=1 Tax=Actinomadura vinacea TaxID=115336 RepID=A0ABN3JQV3_9ACTN